MFFMAGVGAAHHIYEVFGARVRAQRDALNLTQLELSSRIGLTRGSVANIEAGRQSVLLHQLLAIASALQVTPEQLLPAMAEPQAIRRDSEMPETVLTALKAIRKTTGPRSSSRA
jgi:transcriptional regulator with XRE-family HTH domain